MGARSCKVSLKPVFVAKTLGFCVPEECLGAVLTGRNTGSLHGEVTGHELVGANLW